MITFDQLVESLSDSSPLPAEGTARAYLLCYAEPLTRVLDGKALEVRHYAGIVHTATGLDRRMREHRSKNKRKAGALPAAMARLGIPFVVVRTWTVHPSEARREEKRIKRTHGGPSAWCPVHGRSSSRA